MTTASRAGLGRRSGPALAGLAATIVLLGVASLASVAFGARIVGFDDVMGAITGAHDSLAQVAVVQRIPRTVLAIIVGAALGIAGVAMQGVTRNPLADPGILGVSVGASLAVVVGVAFFGLSTPIGYIWVAIAGAALASVAVYTVGSLGPGGATPLKLALSGAAMSAAFASLISAILLPRIEVMDSFRFWQIGGVGGANFESIAQVAPFLLVGAFLCFASARGLNMLALGDDLATGLGQRVTQTRLIASAGAVLLCGGATAVAGPIGFVGIVVPHACRLITGPDHRWLVPYSGVAGATLLTVADIIGRVVARPDEIDVGIVTAIIGAPVFIAVVRRQKVRAL